MLHGAHAMACLSSGQMVRKCAWNRCSAGTSRMRGDYGERRFCDVCLSFASIRVCGRERGACAEENGSVSRSREGWEERPGKLGCFYLCSCLHH